MGEMAIMDKSGDSKLIWDPAVAEEVEAAKNTFEKLRKKKSYVAYSVNEDGEKGEVLHSFDPSIAKMIMAPAMVAG